MKIFSETGMPICHQQAAVQHWPGVCTWTRTRESWTPAALITVSSIWSDRGASRSHEWLSWCQVHGAGSNLWKDFPKCMRSTLKLYINTASYSFRVLLFSYFPMDNGIYGYLIEQPERMWISLKKTGSFFFSWKFWRVIPLQSEFCSTEDCANKNGLKLNIWVEWTLEKRTDTEKKWKAETDEGKQKLENLWERLV